MKDTTNRADRRQAHRVRSEIAAKRSRSPLKIIMVTLTLVITIAFSILPCFATADGGKGQEFFMKQSPRWDALTITNANGDNKTILDFSLTALTDTDGDGQVKDSFFSTSIESEFSRATRILWNKTLPNLGITFFFYPTTPFYMGGDITNTYDTIELGYTGLWVINSTTGEETRVYEYDVGWQTDRGMNFDTATLIKRFYHGQIEATNDTTENAVIEYLDNYATMFSYIDYRESPNKIVYTKDAFTKTLTTSVRTNNDVETGQTYSSFEYAIPTAWQATSNVSNITLNAHDFITTLQGDESSTDITDPNNTRHNIITLSHDPHDQVFLTFKIWYSYLSKEQLSTHTENMWVSKYLEGSYHDFQTEDYPNWSRISFDPIPSQEIINDYNGLLLREGTEIIVERLTVTATYHHYLKDGITPWSYPQEVFIKISTDDDLAETSTLQYIQKMTGQSFNTYPTPEDGNPFEVIDLIAKPVAEFLDINIFGFFTLGNLLSTIIAIGAVFALLKIFAGG